MHAYMEAEKQSTLLLRVLQRAARAARAVVLNRPASPAAAAEAISRTPSLLDCMDDDDCSDSSFRTARSPGQLSSSAASTPPGEAEIAVHYSPGVDVDRRAAEFIERFRRNVSLELRYCSAPSPVASTTSPVRPPVSPDTYFKQSGRLHHDAAAGAPAWPAYGRSSLRARASGVSIKWPTAGRPTLRV